MNRRRIALALVLASVLVARSEGQTVSLGDVIARAGTTAAEFMESFAQIVAEEHYVQDWRTLPAGQTQHRELRADFLLIRLNDGSAFTAFRDVFEQNGRAVRDRDERLLKLLEGDAGDGIKQAERINEESTRYNIGVRRTINNPLLGLALLQDAYRPRFTFSSIGTENVDKIEAQVIRFEEHGRPTIVRGQPGDHDLPLSGRFMIDPRTGDMLRTEITADDGRLRSKIGVKFGIATGIDRRVPVEMTEEYVTSNARVLATARYERFRKFSVKVDEERR